MHRWTLFDKNIFGLFVRPGEIIEARILHASGKSPAWDGFAGGKSSTVSGYFDDHAAFCKAVQAADRAQHGGVYVTVQVIDPRLLGRAFNRLKVAQATTADGNVLAYRWLPVDIDPVRPAGVSSSDAELAEALALRDPVIGWVQEQTGWQDGLTAVSGNGGHVLFRLPQDLPVSEENTTLIRGILATLGDQFDTPSCKIDRAVFNPARIWKFYGTRARKGDPVPSGKYREARPHRESYIDGLFGGLEA